MMYCRVKSGVRSRSDGPFGEATSSVLYARDNNDAEVRICNERFSGTSCSETISPCRTPISDDVEGYPAECTISGTPYRQIPSVDFPSCELC